MTVLLIENIKLIMLFLLIGSIIGLSHLSGENTKTTRHKRLGAKSGLSGQPLEE